MSKLTLTPGATGRTRAGDVVTIEQIGNQIKMEYDRSLYKFCYKAGPTGRYVAIGSNGMYFPQSMRPTAGDVIEIISDAPPTPADLIREMIAQLEAEKKQLKPAGLGAAQYHFKRGRISGAIEALNGVVEMVGIADASK